jgi:hypothetical protein
MCNFKFYEFNYLMNIAEENESSIGRVHKISKSYYQLCHVCLSAHPDVLPHGTTRLQLDGFLLNLIFGYCFPKYFKKFKYH